MTETQKRGYYGRFGGMFIPEILRGNFEELIRHYEAAKADPAFWREYATLMTTYSCRPTPISFAENLTNYFGGAKIFIKREDLNHTGAHKANNVMGQGLLTKRMRKTRVIAETGAGQHGVATATMAAKFGFACAIYMGAVDAERQRPNVFWMEKLGADVQIVDTGTQPGIIKPNEKPKTNHDLLVDDNAAAAAKGMSYGKFKEWQRRQKELKERGEI